MDGPGSFSHRGGILDIYPPDCELPLRIELFDDEIDTIRRFDPLTQRSVGSADEVRLIPAREQLPELAGAEALALRAAAMDLSNCNEVIRERMEEELQSLTGLGGPEFNPESLSFYSGLINRTPLLKYLGPKFESPARAREGRVEAEASELEERFERMRTARAGPRRACQLIFPSPCMRWDEFAALLERPARCRNCKPGLARKKIIYSFRPRPYYGQLEQLSADIQAAARGVDRFTVADHPACQATRGDPGATRGVNASVMGALEDFPSPGDVCILPGSLRKRLGCRASC